MTSHGSGKEGDRVNVVNTFYPFHRSSAIHHPSHLKTKDDEEPNKPTHYTNPNDFSLLPFKIKKKLKPPSVKLTPKTPEDDINTHLLIQTPSLSIFPNFWGGLNWGRWEEGVRLWRWGLLARRSTLMSRKWGVKNNNGNGKKKKRFKTVRSFGRLKKISDDHKSPSPVRFYSGELRRSFSGDDKMPQKSSFLGRASFTGLEKAVDVLDALGSGMTNLSNSGFLTGKTIKGSKISMLAFEVANTITRGANLMHSLSNENVSFMKKEIVSSEGVQSLVSTDTKALLSLAASDKREELDVFCKEVVRFGDLCKDAQWHNLERLFAKMDSENGVYMQHKEQADAKMQELMSLAQHTSELYHELNAFDRFEQDCRQKVEEMKSLNLPCKGEHLMMLQDELRQQKKVVVGLKKKSLWSKKLEEVVEKLVDIVAFIHQEIRQIFKTGGIKAGEKVDTCTERLGADGLALHYANIINQIDNIAYRPTSLPPNVKDTLYHGLPASVKTALRSSLRKLDPVDETDVPPIKAEMENILQWLCPMAANTLKAHQGFGWVGEWANASIEFNKKTTGNGNLMRLQTLYHADKEKMDSYILKLVMLLHRLISGIKRRDPDLFPLFNPRAKR